MKFNIIIAILLQLTVAALLLRSIFFLWRVKGEMKRYTFWFLIVMLATGAGLALWNVSDPDYVIRRFPFNLIYNTLIALAAYYYTQQTKENLFTIENVLKREYTRIETIIVNKVKAEKMQNSEKVTLSDLLVFQVAKYYKIDKKIMLIRLIGPRIEKVGSYSFKVSMLKGGLFGTQYHPDLQEEIHIDKGSVLDRVSGKVFNEGDIWIIKPGEDHSPEALSRVELRAYLYPVK